MGKPQSTGNLVNAIAQDSSNNIGIGGAANASFKLQVTGTTNLTGALSGTSATFSGNLEVFSGSAGVTVGDFLVNPTTKYVYVGRQSSTSGDNTIFVVRDRTGSARATIPGGGSIDTVFSTNNSNFIVSNYSGNSLMTIANTGAATFSSSVTTDGNITLKSGSQLLLGNSNYASTMQIWNSQSGAANNFLIYDNAASAYRFVIDSSGNVGIGTSSPNNYSGYTTLTINSNTTGSVLDLDYNNVRTATISIDANTFYVGSETSIPMLLQTNGTERMRITSGGSVGIGTTDPSGTKLRVEGGELRVTTTNLGVALYRTGSSGEIAAYNWDGGAWVSLGYAALSHIWKVSGTEAMRITSGGFVLINTTSVSAGYKLKVEHSGSGGILAAATGTGDANFFSSSDSIGYHFYCDRGSAARFYVIGTGQIYSTSTSITAISDIRHKENIRPLETGLAEILQLKPSRFDWKEGKGTGKKDVAGFIAQDIEEIFPDLVDEWKEKMHCEETYKAIRMSDLIPTLVKSIQELEARIKQLENK